VRRPKLGRDSTSTGLDRDELARLVAVAAEDSRRSHVLVLLLGLNGLRITEALSIDVGDLGSERGHRESTLGCPAHPGLLSLSTTTWQDASRVRCS